MPIEKVNGGYKWGKSGKVYPTKAQAAKQARAAYASGYKGYQSGGSVWVTEDEEVSPAVQAIRDADKQFKRDFAKRMLMTGIMSNPKARQNFMLAKMFRDQGPMGLGKALGQRAGIEALFRKVGPWGMLLQNKGGPLGLGIMSSKRPMSSRIMQGLLDPRVSGRLKLAQAFPGIFALGWGLNKIQQRIPGQKGILGQGLGPQLRNLFSRILPIKSYEEKYGMEDSPIQEIEVTARKRGTPEERAREKAEAFNRSIAMNEAMLRGRIEETGGLPFEKLTGLSPGAAQSLNQGLRAGNIGRMLAKRAAARALTGREAKVNRSGLDPVTGKPTRWFSSGQGGRK
tara:strand:+ start:2248 stop:3270 length:1023 start_codon:yes stop_codon:yes gene_type:complete